jgi:hypothetical protein
MNDGRSRTTDHLERRIERSAVCQPVLDRWRPPPSGRTIGTSVAS